MITNENINQDKKALWCYWCDFHFPTGAGNRWGSRGVGKRPRQRGRLPQRVRGSSSAQLLMPCYPRAIHHGSLRVRYVLHPKPPAPSIPHFPLWISTADSCQDRADVPKHPPTLYLHVFSKLVWMWFTNLTTCHSSGLSVWSLHCSLCLYNHYIQNWT